MNNILDPAVHGRLIKDLDGYARRAGLGGKWKHMIETPLSDHCGEEEILFMKRFNRLKGEYNGAVYLGDWEEPSVRVRMLALCGAFIRNFIGAQVIGRERLLDLAKDDDVPLTSVLLVPDFFLGEAATGSVASWEVASLMTVLGDRQQNDLKTILYVRNMGQLKNEYGTEFKSIIEDNYLMFTGGE